MNKRRHGILCGLLAFLMLAVTACGNPSTESSSSQAQSSSSSSSSSEATVPAGTNAFLDPGFAYGFDIYGTGINGATRDLQKTIKFQDNETPIWSLAQWYSQHKLDQGTLTLNDNLFKIEDEAKSVQVNRRTGAMTMALDASKEFTSVQTPGSVFWPHLLLEQTVAPLQFKNCTSMRAYLKFRMDRATDCSSKFGSLPIVMQAQFAWFIYVKNVNMESPGLGEFLWFGFNLYDPTKLYTSTISQQDFAGGTAGNYIYAVGAQSWLQPNTKVEIGKTVVLDVDMVKLVKKALNVAHDAGFMMNTTIEDCAVTGTNIGFEVFDVWDIQATIFNLGVYYT